MLQKVSISRFKVLQHLEDVSLGKITLIGGKNNTGKSTLLEALFTYMDIKNPEVFVRLSAWRGLRGMRLEAEALWGPFFTDFDMSKGIDMGITDSTGRNRDLHITYQNKYVPKIPIPVKSDGLMTQGLSSSAGFQSLTLEHKTDGVSDFCARLLLHSGDITYQIDYDTSDLLHPTYFMGSAMLNAPENIELLSILDKREEQDKILGILQTLEPSLKRFQLIREGQKDFIYADLGNKRKFPVNILGTGFCRCLTIALILAAGNKEVLFIDEIENGIHYSLLPEFWEFVIKASQNYNCQIIATTHSHEMIQSFCEKAQEKQFTDLAYIRLSKKESLVSAYQFNFDEMTSALDFEMEVR